MVQHDPAGGFVDIRSSLFMPMVGTTPDAVEHTINSFQAAGRLFLVPNGLMSQNDIDELVAATRNGEITATWPCVLTQARVAQ